MQKFAIGRRALGGAVGIALLGAALTGCTVQSGSSGNGQTLTVWTYYSDTLGKAELHARDTAWEAANPGWKVNQVQVPFDQLDQKLIAAAQTGNGPDVVVNNVVVDFPTLVAAGVLKDISSEWGAFADKAKFPSTAVWKSDGKVYNVMSYTNLLGLYMNTTITSQYGITQMPTTAAELEADLAKIKAGGKYEGLAEAGNPGVEGAWLFMPWLLSQNVNYCQLGQSTDKVTAAYSMISKWSKAGYLAQAASTWDQATAWQKFMTGDYAFGFNGNWNLGDATKNAKFTFQTGQFPSFDGSGRSTVYAAGEGLGIFGKTTHAAQAWDYLSKQWLSSDAELRNLKNGGSLPNRADLVSDSAVSSNTALVPFARATQNTAPWPNNPKTADMQTAIGKAVSAAISGQQDGPTAAGAAISGVQAAQTAGGGGC